MENRDIWQSYIPENITDSLKYRKNGRFTLNGFDSMQMNEIFNISYVYIIFRMFDCQLLCLYPSHFPTAPQILKCFYKILEY